MLVRIFLLLVLFATNSIAESESKVKDKTAFIDNGKVRLGVNMSAGGSIFYFGRSGKDENLLNHFDRGRFIQQSYYGKKDGSEWAGKPWKWNPVQGGHYEGKGAKVLEFKHEKNLIYLKSIPVHWATGENLKDCTMEQWIKLNDLVVDIRYKFLYKGKEKHPAKHQEMPAVFVDAAYANLTFYDGKKPWTGDKLTSVVPGWPNEYKKIKEHWAAFVNDKQWGIGVYTPNVEQMTCYRHVPLKVNGPKAANCSYFSPIKTFSIESNKAVDYHTYLTLGNIDNIRKAFYQIRKKSK